MEPACHCDMGLGQRAEDAKQTSMRALWRMPSCALSFRLRHCDSKTAGAQSQCLCAKEVIREKMEFEELAKVEIG